MQMNSNVRQRQCVGIQTRVEFSVGSLSIHGNSVLGQIGYALQQVDFELEWKLNNLRKLQFKEMYLKKKKQLMTFWEIKCFFHLGP